MRNFFFLAALLVLAACDKDSPGGRSAGTRPGECILTARFDAPGTKVAGQTPANEKAIQNVQIFVFRAGEGRDDGVLEVAAPPATGRSGPW